MKKLFYICTIGVLLCSCTPSHIFLKGNYENPNRIFISEKSKDEVWNKIIQFFARSGVGGEDY